MRKFAYGPGYEACHPREEGNKAWEGGGGHESTHFFLDNNNNNNRLILYYIGSKKVRDGGSFLEPI